MIASVAFRRFKALRSAQLTLAPFNVIIGPNGSGKTSLIEALLRLRWLSRLPLAPAGGPAPRPDGPEIEFRFEAPYEGLVARLACISDVACDLLRIEPPESPDWPALRGQVAGIRSYVLEHLRIGEEAVLTDGHELQADGGNLAAVVARLARTEPEAYAHYRREVLRLAPEFAEIECRETNGRVRLYLRLVEGETLALADLSQGHRYLLALLALAHQPNPAPFLCIEEIDRGLHPRMLREVRDALYRLTHPASRGLSRRPVQIVTTTHSPYFIDLFRDHPEEVVIAHKVGRAAHFERLVDRPDLPELLAEGSLGEMWFSGVLGGIPEGE